MIHIMEYTNVSTYRKITRINFLWYIINICLKLSFLMHMLSILSSFCIVYIHVYFVYFSIEK